MAKINIAIVHGIGINTVGYADALIKGIAQQFNAAIRRERATSQDYTDQLNFVPVVWDDIVGPAEAKLEDIFRENFKKRAAKSALEKLAITGVFLGVAIVLFKIFHNHYFFLLLAIPGIYYGLKIILWLRTRFAANFVADITSYNDDGSRKLILQRLEQACELLAGPSGIANLTLISHSLGTVIASDFVWEAQKPGKLLERKLFLSNFFTMGSPLPLFSLRFGGPEVFNKPITIQDAEGKWVNIYDKDDPIAYPLKPLNEAYDQTVWKDQEVNVGLFGLAHVNYWASPQVHTIIAEKLAADWLRLNKN